MNLNHGDLEKLILNILWDNSENNIMLMNVAQVMDKLNTLNTKKKWAYTTVKTILDRLTDKGFLNKLKNGKKFNYEIIVNRNVMAEKALKKIAFEYFSDDFTRVIKLVEKISKNEDTIVHEYK